MSALDYAVVLGLAIAGTAVGALTGHLSIEDKIVQVIDGDTVVTDNHDRVRLVGFNAPELDGCRTDLAQAAANMLKDEISHGAKLRLVACSCRPGAEGTSACNYGRRCGVLTTKDGFDFGQRLISSGLAVPYICGPTSCPPRPDPWCGP